VAATSTRGHVLRFAAVLALLVLLTATGAWLPPYWRGLVVEALIWSLFAMSLDLLLGYTGLPSLGHAAYFGAGAYLAAIAAVKIGLDFWLAAALGIVGGAAVAALAGAIVLRTQGVFFLMITLAVAQILWAVAYGWRSVTGGDDGLRGLARSAWTLGGIDLSAPVNFYYVTLIVVALCAGAMALIVASPFGQGLKGVRESPARMDALGYHVWSYRFLAFVLSGAFAAIAGVLHVRYKNFVSPESLSIVVSAEVLLMVIVGGAGTLFGSFIGAFAIVFLSNWSSAYTDRWVLILGVIYVLVVLLAPEGLVGLVRDLAARLRGRPA
jgi:branched-chain amino acid transport system permease protein